MGHNESSADKKSHSSEYHQKEAGSSYTSSLTAHLKALEQKEANSPNRNRQQEIIKLGAEINQMEIKRTIKKIDQTSSCFFEKIKKIDKHLARLTRGHRDSILINKIRNEKGDIQQILKKSKMQSDPSTKSHTQQNWKTWMKWTNF